MFFNACSTRTVSEPRNLGGFWVHPSTNDMNPYTSFNLWRSESVASRFNGEVYPGHDNDVRIGFNSNANLACPGLNKSWAQQSQLPGKRTTYWHLMCTTQGPITYQEKELRLTQDISNQLNLNAITVVAQTVSYCNPPTYRWTVALKTTNTNLMDPTSGRKGFQDYSQLITLRHMNLFLSSWTTRGSLFH